MNPHPIYCEVQVFDDSNKRMYLERVFAKFEVMPRVGDYVTLQDFVDVEFRVDKCNIYARGSGVYENNTVAMIQVIKSA
jgi:hypothetical protein